MSDRVDTDQMRRDAFELWRAEEWLHIPDSGVRRAAQELESAALELDRLRLKNADLREKLRAYEFVARPIFTEVADQVCDIPESAFPEADFDTAELHQRAAARQEEWRAIATRDGTWWVGGP